MLVTLIYFRSSNCRLWINSTSWLASSSCSDCGSILEFTFNESNTIRNDIFSKFISFCIVIKVKNKNYYERNDTLTKLLSQGNKAMKYNSKITEMNHFISSMPAQKYLYEVCQIILPFNRLNNFKSKWIGNNTILYFFARYKPALFLNHPISGRCYYQYDSMK